jgi:hypothetical protein
MTQLQLIFVLLAVYQVKHYVADYLLQGKYMLQKFRADWGFFVPLLAHVSVHAAATFLIASWFNVLLAVKLALFDAFIHFTMDRIKASPKLLGRFTPDNKFFWWALGVDQMVHHLTHYAIIWFIITR